MVIQNICLIHNISYVNLDLKSRTSKWLSSLSFVIYFFKSFWLVRGPAFFFFLLKLFKYYASDTLQFLPCCFFWETKYIMGEDHRRLERKSKRGNYWGKTSTVLFWKGQEKFVLEGYFAMSWCFIVAAAQPILDCLSCKMCCYYAKAMLRVLSNQNSGFTVQSFNE